MLIDIQYGLVLTWSTDCQAPSQDHALCPQLSLMTAGLQDWNVFDSDLVNLMY